MRETRYPWTPVTDPKWDRRFLELAALVSTWSKDPSTKVGSVIVDEDRHIISTGFNGFPRGVVDRPDRLAERPTKYGLVVHAEMNAILAASRRGANLSGTLLYSTGPACSECMKAIVQCGIVRVAWPVENPFETEEAAREGRWATSFAFAELLAEEGGVGLERVLT